MGHYYEFDENLKSNIRVLKLYINDKILSFESDSGVFSNTEIDYGSFTLLKSILQEEKVNKILDVGCGYGVLGITLKYFDKCDEVTMVDINKKAVELTSSNAVRIGINNYQTFVSDCLEKVKDNYDSIVINPPIRAGKKVIYKMFLDSINHLNENGYLYIVIKKSLGAESALKELKTIYKSVEVIKKDKGYFIIKSIK